MRAKIKGLLRRISPLGFLPPEGDEGIALRGHREYVGGKWDEIGQLQFDFLLKQGLKPEHYLLDIACGSLRLGVKAIPYLERGHYLGIEKEPGLLRAGIEQELGDALAVEKAPALEVSDSFEFERLGQQADIAIAQSLFTHLTPALINLCFKNLHPWLKDGGEFFATYHRAERPAKNPKKPHASGFFAYTEDQMKEFGESNGFTFHYIGDWNHPRKQVMTAYMKK